MLNTIERINNLHEEAKKNDSTSRTVKSCNIGDVIRQGDLYLHKVEDNHPVGARIKRRKLAEGTSIGSRHILVGDAIVYEGKILPIGVNTDHPLGLCFDVVGKGALVTHPEHADVRILQKGRWQVTHQMDMRTRQRVAD